VLNQLYFGKRDTYYYLELANKSQVRDNLISDLLGQEYTKLFYSSVDHKETPKIYLAKFWKDRSSIERALRFMSNNYRIVEVNQETFTKLIPDQVGEKENSNYKRNIKNKRQDVKYLREWKEYRKKYKCTSAYKRVSDPQKWLPCKNCGLIPLVWEFDNGRKTGCGCGKNDYDHFSIQAESVMSFVTRHKGSVQGFSNDSLQMNWNQWVMTGQDIFGEMKKYNQEIW
jgi:hypothetical protein